jgi:hypothetical protein
MRIGKDRLEIVNICTSKSVIAAASLDLAKVVLERIRHSLENTYAALCELSGVLESTLWHRDYGRDSI